MGHGTSGNSIRRSLGLAAGLCLGVAAGTAAAQGLGITWHTIGAPGNDPWDDERYPNATFRGRGRVDHLYRMSETELTNEQWLEFVRAYGPYADDPFDSNLLGQGIEGTSDNGQLEYEIIPGFEGLPANMSWRHAARFCNWMHNAQVNEAWAFESGAYDTSTFTGDGSGELNDQDTRSPGARYWIPSMDEWMKAAHYDPDRYGPGEPGWWGYPNRSDEPLICGRPRDGGQTNAALLPRYGWSPDLKSGLYPDEQSPWGLLDLSGGWRELTEEWYNHGQRYSKGSTFGDDVFWEIQDWVGGGFTKDDPTSAVLVGLRAASRVPGPGDLALVLSCLPFLHGRNRRCS
ncbi:MAG: SUMF1/EgtB/PvdO family nonheme iron enzyme [Phycisphaerales bacterium]|nr:SUMF1/EgtB/PvdO family nonheme iron enzyme [Phycisphaerales bacterium]